MSFSVCMPVLVPVQAFKLEHSIFTVLLALPICNPGSYLAFLKSIGWVLDGKSEASHSSRHACVEPSLRQVSSPAVNFLHCAATWKQWEKMDSHSSPILSANINLTVLICQKPLIWLFMKSFHDSNFSMTSTLFSLPNPRIYIILHWHISGYRATCIQVCCAYTT